MKTPDPFLDADQLRSASFVRHVEIHDMLGSTNDRAAELARQLTAGELPALIVARHQTAGRGRGRNTWWSGEGALTFSLLIEPAAMGISTANWPQLSLATAVAVCDGLQNRVPQSKIGIKWPNDVLIDGCKVCGILIESPGGPAPAKDRLIIGIGINVNNSWRAAPNEAGSAGMALCDVHDRQHELTPILTGVLDACSRRIDQLRTHDADLVRAWQRLNSLAGKRVVLESEGLRIEGDCTSVADDGAIVIETAGGPQRRYSGTVRLSN